MPWQSKVLAGTKGREDGYDLDMPSSRFQFMERVVSKKPMCRVPTYEEAASVVDRMETVIIWGQGTLSHDELHILRDYISHLENNLCELIAQYHGEPTEYFNYVRRQHLEYRPLGPTRLF